MNRSFIVLILAVLASQACAYDKAASADAKTQTQELRWLHSTKPQVELNNAIQKQDFRFRSFNGVGSIVPGIYITCLDRDAQIHPIKGTSDTHESREHEKLNKLAIKHAKSYNTKLLKHIIETQDFGCDN